MTTRATLPMVAVAAIGLTLASRAEAVEFECTIPWWRPLPVQCGNLVSLRPGETMRIDLLSVKDDNGTNQPGTVDITIVDTNTKKTVTNPPLKLQSKTLAWYKNETKAEIVGRADVTYEHHVTVTIKLRSTIEH